MHYSEWLPTDGTYDKFRDENARIEALPWYDDVNVRYSHDFGKLVAEVRARCHEARSSDS